MKKQQQKEPGDTQTIAQETIEEARMVLPGIQALFGFQLIAAFNDRFQKLDPIDQQLHYVSLILIALAVALIMTPAVYHRLVEQTSVSEFFIRLASCRLRDVGPRVMVVWPSAPCDSLSISHVDPHQIGVVRGSSRKHSFAPARPARQRSRTYL